MEVAPPIPNDEVGRMAKRRRRDNDAVQPVSDDAKLVSFCRRIKIPDYLFYGYGEYDMRTKLVEWLPVAGRTLFRIQDWSLLQEFSAPVPKPSPEEALDSELAALCVLILFILDIPRKMKRGIIRAFGNICLGPSFKPTKMSTDQESVEKLLLRALKMGDTEVRRQVCLAIAFLASLSAVQYVTITFGSAIQHKLLQLVQNSDSNLTFPVLCAVTALCQSSKEMKEEIVRTEVKDYWLSNIICTRQDDNLILERACLTVGSISCYGKLTEGLWDHLKKIFPIIFKMPFEDESGITRGAARAIFEVTEYASPCQIKELADLDGLKVLFDFLDLADSVTFNYSVTAIERILKVGDKDVLKVRLGKGNGEAGDEDVLRARSGEGEGGVEDVLGKFGEDEGKGVAGDKDVLGECKAGDEDVLGKDGAGYEGVLGEDCEGGEGEGEGEEGDGEEESEGEDEEDEGEDSESESESEDSESDEESESDDENEVDDESDTEGVAEENEYAKMIDGYCPGWRMLAKGYGAYFVRPSMELKARRLLKKYRPAVYADACRC